MKVFVFNDFLHSSQRELKKMTSFVVSGFDIDLRGAELLQFHPCISAHYRMTIGMLHTTMRNARESVKVVGVVVPSLWHSLQ